MIGLTVKNIIIKKQLKKKNSKFLVIYFVLFSRTVSMRIGWFTDVPPRMPHPMHTKDNSQQFLITNSFEF